MTTKRRGEQAPCPNHPDRKATTQHGCSTCYQRRRRGSTRTQDRIPDAVMLAPLPLDPREDMLLRAAAELEGVSVAAWVRLAIRARLMRETLARPDLRALGNDVLGVVSVSESKLKRPGPLVGELVGNRNPKRATKIKAQIAAALSQGDGT